MKDRLLQTVKNFLNSRSPLDSPLLLGLSGGPDSLALFHLLLETSSFVPFKLHVAHVDHGWREESSKEAQWLKSYVEKWGVPFYLKKLEGCLNEEAAREGRLSFFSSLYRELGCKALLLGHQGDDQAETVL